MKTNVMSFSRKKVGAISIILALAFIVILASCTKDPSIVVVPTVPVVSTTDVTNITTTSATLGGNVSSEGDALVQERGLCWGLYSNPSISDNKLIAGVGSGSFTGTISGLTPATTYHVRAYAKNSVGTAYGSDLLFTTVSAKHIVSIAVGPYGTANLLGPIEVADNGSLKIHLTPSTWYVAESVVIGTTTTPLTGDDYELKNITKDYNLNFTFKLNPVWFQALIGRTWVTTREKQRLVGSMEWTIVPPDKLVVQKNSYHSDFKVDIIRGTMDLGSFPYSWQGDSIIRSANPNTGQGGIRQRIIFFTKDGKDSLVLRRLIKGYDSYPDKPNPNRDLEIEETFKPIE